MITPAKVTLRMEVPARRPDGYHEVRIALAPVSLYDTLHCALNPEGMAPGEVALDVTCEHAADAAVVGAPEHNLAVRAARALLGALAASGRELPALRLHLHKRIPVGAGLGGGSGNAGGVLVALNRLLGAPLDTEALEDLAATLGMDVPFFVQARAAWAEGRGERLRPLAVVAGLELLVVKPPFAISTGEAYGHVTPQGALPEGDPPMETPAQVCAALFNGFEAALFPRHPELAELRTRLLDTGAEGALLSGSGSALFGVYPDAATRERAAQALSAEAARQDWRLLPCRTLARHDYDPQD